MPQHYTHHRPHPRGWSRTPSNVLDRLFSLHFHPSIYCTLHNLAAYPVSQSLAPIRDYVALLKQLGAHVPTAATCRPPGWPGVV